MFSLRELNAMPTLSVGQTDDLKIETAKRRVWLSRMTVADGMPYAHQVTDEIFNGRRWEICATYQAK